MGKREKRKYNKKPGVLRGGQVPANRKATSKALKGNQFWKCQAKHGKDKLFTEPELLLEEATRYFDWCDSNPFKEGKQRIRRPYSLIGFCLFIGVSSTFLKDFAWRLRKKPDDLESQAYLTVIQKIKDVIETQQWTGATVGFFNPNIIARTLGLRDGINVGMELDDRRQTTAELFPDELKDEN